MFFIDRYQDLSLDIVGFLAILGEGSILANAQVSTLSRSIFLPRLLPAPQALLRPARPEKLEPTPGYVTGVHSGNNRTYINHIGQIVLDAENMQDFDVRCVEIKREKGTAHWEVKAKTLSLVTGVTILGCAFSIALLVLSIVWDDGMALLATVSLSALSTIIGIGNKWTLQFAKRNPTPNSRTPDGDVVVRYPKGSFLVVKCTEDVARELYFAPENIHYMVPNPVVYRLISLCGTMLLMVGVVALGNARVQSQTAFGAAYMLLNAAYWLVAAVPSKAHWDTSPYTVIDQRIEGSLEGRKYHIDRNDSFTQALWKVIIITKDARWIRLSNAAPQTTSWDEWLFEAVKHAKTAKTYTDDDGTLVYRKPDWNPQEALGFYLNSRKTDLQEV
ncbi:hypothetical protein M501DRAFT_993025 [Patellaria atrata CBS 101060]|uniref:Uncharacterized protein n=1 Tax=Patellaria atrata CBS 101060 TaxID=1346257 RepID=A0A9P4S913_9PEZI|nr:hypothetical protein M501DRAFT_993025 [Patellaria atrata CBS 101060]